MKAALAALLSHTEPKNRKRAMTRAAIRKAGIVLLVCGGACLVLVRRAVATVTADGWGGEEAAGEVGCVAIGAS